MSRPTAPSPPATPGPDSGRSAVLVGAGVMLSRLSGVLRELVLAGLLGLTVAADAFKAALQIPGLLQNVLGEGVLSASFIPVYSDLVESEDEDEAGRVAGAVLGLLGLLTAAIVVLGVVAARPITRMILPFLADDTYELTVSLVRIMWIGLGFIVLSAWCLGVLNTHRRFFLSYVAPVLWNAAQVVLALAAWIRDWSLDDIARAAAWGVTAGGVLQFAVQLPAVLRVAPRLRISLDRRRPAVRTVIRRFGPAVLGRGVVQVSAFIDLFLAGLLASGAIAALSASQVMYLLPIGVFAMGVAAADLPELSRERDVDHLIAARLRVGLERVGFFVLFSAVAFVTMGKLVVGALYQRGEFGADDTILVWLTLAGYSLGLVGSASSRVLQNACYARGDVRGPAQLAAIRVGVAAVLGFALMFQADRLGIVDGSIERLGDLPAFTPLSEGVREDETLPLRLGAAGLALGGMVAAWLEYALLKRRVTAQLPRARRLRQPAWRYLPAAGVSGALGIIATIALDGFPPLLAAPIALAVTGVVYVMICARAGSSSARLLLRAARLG
ncbi:MAG: murein biosynthesis integral membrane protein MurJ [Acidimicrobiales bacterium]|nr:murein biosynthesis integral membrane protein MurJ [Acidimicrobiales bacterium]